MLRSILIFIVFVLLPSQLLAQQSCAAWPEWQTFKDNFITEQGRVVDLGSKQHITTSEGQSYALFFALVANDKAMFDKLINWTERHLAEGDLSARLPAWKWGRKPSGDYAILDSNPASDSDLWIAYALAEAGRLWQERRYSVLAYVMARRILREETEPMPGLGLTLMPAPYGFETDENTWRLNPSYLFMPIFNRFATLYPNSPWQEVAASSMEVLTQSAPNGVSPDWVLYNAEKGFHYTKQHSDIGNYNAIRVYLWTGMMHNDDPNKSRLLATFKPFADHITQFGRVPLDTYAQSGNMEKRGPVGFSAASLPFLLSLDEQNAFSMQSQQVMVGLPKTLTDSYYSSVLGLYGTGFAQNRYYFTAGGEVVTNWSLQCK